MPQPFKNKNTTLLSVRNLKVTYVVGRNKIRAVNGVSLDVYENECVAIVGESGSGKSTLALALMKLLPESAVIEDGQIIFKGVDIIKLNEEELHKIRGKDISMIFQDPTSYLNPVYSVGEQLVETILTHNNGLEKREAVSKAVDLLNKVGIPEAERILKYYPHQLSGGMAQRVSIALALASNPSLLIADEPTSALDLTIQAQILKLLRDLMTKLSLSIILITHDLSIVAYLADRVYVMYMGKIVEEDYTESLFKMPKHPYTQLLLNSVKSIYGYEDSLKYTKVVEQPIAEFTGCRFRFRCPYTLSRCSVEEPPLIQLSDYKKVSCWLYGDDK